MLVGMCSREFNHRVKGISMSSFTSDEVDALEAMGNKVLVHASPALLCGHVSRTALIWTV